MKKLFSFVSLMLLVLSMIAVNTATSAPKVGTAKAQGNYGSGSFWGQSGGRSMRHARDYSRGYQSYSRQSRMIEPQIARHEALGVGQNIKSAQSNFAEMSKSTTSKETLAALKSINTQLSLAAKSHEQMHEMCKMETVDGVSTMKCCEEIDAALSRAIEEQKKLMKHLEGETSPTASNK